MAAVFVVGCMNVVTLVVCVSVLCDEDEELEEVSESVVSVHLYVSMLRRVRFLEWARLSPESVNCERDCCAVSVCLPAFLASFLESALVLAELKSSSKCLLLFRSARLVVDDAGVRQ